MDNKKLDALEEAARALRDAKDREEALKGVAELRSLRVCFDREVEEAVRQASSGPAREPMSFLESLRLSRRLRSDDDAIKKQAMAEIRLEREKEDHLIERVGEKLKNPLYQEQVKARFRSRKWLFRLITLLLIAAMIPVLAAAGSLGLSGGATKLAVAVCLGLGYFYAKERLWRCPACDFRLPLNAKSGRSVAKLCPRCGASLS